MSRKYIKAQLDAVTNLERRQIYPHLRGQRRNEGFDDESPHDETGGDLPALRSVFSRAMKLASENRWMTLGKNFLSESFCTTMVREWSLEKSE